MVIGIEVSKIKDIWANESKRVDDTFTAFKHCHVRSTIGEPDLSIDFVALKKLLNVTKIGSLKVNEEYVQESFSLQTENTTGVNSTRLVFNQAFNQLATNNTTDLIIDMRNNHGGHDLVGMALMSHLRDSIFYYYKRRTALVKPVGKFVKKGNIYEIVGRNGWIGKVVPAQQVYKGNLYILMNGYSVSAAAEFIGHLKNNNRAIFIGEEEGGNPVIFTGGQTLPIDLPHTHVTGILPLHLNEMNVTLKNTGHGVIPDYLLKPTIKDILEEKDVEMEFVMKLIQK